MSERSNWTLKLHLCWKELKNEWINKLMEEVHEPSRQSVYRAKHTSLSGHRWMMKMAAA